MAEDSNTSSVQAGAALSQEIKELKSKFFSLVNNYKETQIVTADNLEEKTLCYLDGLRADIQSSEIPVTTDLNLLTSQYLNDLKGQVAQMEQLVAFHKGLGEDIDASITRYENLISLAEEKTVGGGSSKLEVKPEHLQAAKQKFLTLKTEFHGLVCSLYPNVSDELIEVLSHLMQEKMNGESNGYVEIVADEFPFLRVLEQMGVVIRNPYNNREIKFALEMKH